ncbi:MAG: hypothetical protein LBP89_08830 [Helicobacteraceae bacterium]|nr:hypothetical protein [Helicobacteraceae bacterium]
MKILSPLSNRRSLKQSFLKRSRNLFASIANVSKAFAPIFASTPIGCEGGGGGSSDDETPASYKVSFYNADLDFVKTIEVKQGLFNPSEHNNSAS